jgi:hypothetical protein
MLAPVLTCGVKLDTPGMNANLLLRACSTNAMAKSFMVQFIELTPLATLLKTRQAFTERFNKMYA